MRKPGAKTDLGKSLFKASNGGRIDILREWGDVTESELQQGFGMYVLLALKVRPEAFPTRSPRSVRLGFMQYLGREGARECELAILLLNYFFFYFCLSFSSVLQKTHLPSATSAPLSRM